MKNIFFIIALVADITMGVAQETITHSYLNHLNRSTELMATYSIVGWDSVTGDLGVAVQSEFLSVGVVVPYAGAGVGAIVTQAWANTTFGPRGLELLTNGSSAKEVIEQLIQIDSNASYRQIGIVDSHGNAYAYTGSACQQWCGHVIGYGYSVQGNILASEDVVKAMARIFELTEGPLAERLLAALEAGEKAGGDKRGRQSAALLVVRDQGGYSGYNDKFIDLRVDDDSLPLVELRRLYNLWGKTFLPEACARSIEVFNRKKNFVAAQVEKERVVHTLMHEVQAKPDDSEVLNNVAWILSTNEIDREGALVYAKRAVTFTPNKLEYLNTLAECHFRLGHFDEAVAIEADLVTKEPSNDSYWKQLQKFKEAKQKSGR